MKSRHVILLFVLAVLTLGQPYFASAECSSPLWLLYSGPDMCYYYTNLVITAGPTDCKMAGAQKSEATASCPSTPSNNCTLSRSSTTVTKYNLSGNISWDKWGGLSAGYASETTTVVACNVTVPLGPLSCGEPPFPPSQHCCKEAWETQRTTSKRYDIYSVSPSGFDTGECNGPMSGGTYQCQLNGTLTEVLNSNCSDCTNLPGC